ncbi:MAG: hypothetical protein IRY91_16935 [Gemmatimonadaceae bacterium]|nr:hypothetical protein [Gemmatimonadaceae bacterium]
MHKMNAEPIGIIISQGTREEPKPAFWAYVWGPAPEDAAASAGWRAA